MSAETFAIQLDAEIVERTGWTYQQIQDQPHDWLMELVTYWNEKSAWEQETIEASRTRAQSGRG